MKIFKRANIFFPNIISETIPLAIFPSPLYLIFNEKSSMSRQSLESLVRNDI